jgi:lipoate---protein ligase
MKPLQFCDLTLPSPEENLALDEALLDRSEARAGTGVLRFWEARQAFVVVGYANAVSREVNLDYCAAHSIPVLRRCTGGGTVLQGPGCLNYSLVLPVGREDALNGIHATNRFVMERLREAVQRLLPQRVELRGCTDLAIGDRKFAGNAQRRKKTHLLFHGCFLINADLGLISQALPQPSREPDYRAGRAHDHFLMNLPARAEALKQCLRATWNALEPCGLLADQSLAPWVEKYRQENWNRKF